MKPFLSLCMIVKDEEQLLKRCLDSVNNIVDEIIIVDTGSTDSTKQIALNYVDTLYEFQWIDDFSAARNFAQSKANGEWILVLDADEYVDSNNLIEVINLLKKESGETDAFTGTIYNFQGDLAEHLTQHRSIRLYQNRDDIQYKRAIHEQIVKENGNFKINESQLMIYHTGYMPQVVKIKKKYERNKKLIDKEITKTEKNSFDYFNLGNEYKVNGEVEKALDAYVKAYQRTDDMNYDWVPLCLFKIVTSLIELNRNEDALKVILDAEQLFDKSPDFKYFKAHIYYNEHRIDDAYQELIDLIEYPEKYQKVIYSVESLDMFPLTLLAKISIERNQPHLAIKYLIKALSINPKNKECFYEFLKLLTKFSEPQEVLQFIKSNFDLRNELTLQLVIKILLSLGDVQFADYFISLNKDSIEKQAFKFKLEILKGEYNCNYKLETILELMINNTFDLFDLIIYAFEIDNISFTNQLINYVSNESDRKFLELIFYEKESNVLKVENFITLLDRIIVYKKFDLFEQILPLKSSFNFNEVHLLIGHLLYRQDFTDLAVTFYQEVTQDLLDKEALINIIAALKDIEDEENGLQIAVNALQSGQTDFRFFKYIIEALEKQCITDELIDIIQLAQTYYPDSFYLKERLIENQFELDMI